MTADTNFPDDRRQILMNRGLMAFALCMVVGLALVYPFPMEGRLWGEIFDLAHAPIFFCALLCLVAFFDPVPIGLPSRFLTIVPLSIGHILLLVALLMIVGMVGEFLQQFVGRSCNWKDVAANGVGVSAALVWILGQRLSGFGRFLLSVIAIASLAVVSVSTIQEIMACVQQKQNFPLLSSFEDARELGSWLVHSASAEVSTDWATDGRNSGK